MNDSKYEELVGKYIDLKNKINILEKEKKEIYDQIDELMHNEQVNEKKIFIRELNDEYLVQYVSRKLKSVDYVLLSEIVTEEIYDKIVEEKESVYLKIGPTPKETKKKREKPVQDENRKPGLSIPKAKLML